MKSFNRVCNWCLDNAGVLFLATIVAWGAWAIVLDIVVAVLKGIPFTISVQTQTFCRQNPIAAFIAYVPIGLLTSHFMLVRDLPVFSPEQPIHAAGLGAFAGAAAGYFWWLQRIGG